MSAQPTAAVEYRERVGEQSAEELASREERELVKRAQDGDLTAFEELYRRTAGLVHALCLRLTGDSSRAEDLVQDAYVRAWQKLSSFRGESAFATWLTRLTVNVALSERRGRLRWESRTSLMDDLEPVAGSAPAPLPGTRLDLERAIAALPRGARTAFVLHDVHGYGHAEIARATGSAIGTCKAQLHRARRLLREVLK